VRVQRGHKTPLRKNTYLVEGNKHDILKDYINNSISKHSYPIEVHYGKKI